MTIPVAIIGAEFVRNAQALLEREVIGIMPGELQDTRVTQRQTYNFGYDYNRLKEKDYSRTKIPGALVKLLAEAIKQLVAVTGRPLPKARDFTNCIVSVYEPGYRLQPHVDVDRRRSAHGQFDFYFGDNIVGVVIKADTRGGLYLREGRGPSEPIKEVDGTAYLLSGPNRYKPHGITPIENRRISATFRTVHFN